MREQYPIIGPNKTAELLKRPIGSVNSRARKWKLFVPIHSDGDKLWTPDEIELVRNRYPKEGAAKLAKDLNRTRPSIRMCAVTRGIKIDKNTYVHAGLGKVGPNAGTFRGHGRVYGTYAKRLKGRGWPCDVTAEYLNSIITDTCPISGRPLVFPAYSTDTTANASVDRIDSSKGYVKGNVQWVDKRVNWMKSDMTERELFDFCQDIVNTLSFKYL